VYAKNLKAHKGTENRILIEMVNQDQKPVPITDMVFLFRLISNDEVLLLEKELVIVNDLKGQAVLTLTAQELDQMESETMGYSIEQVANINEPMFVDDNAGARGWIEITDSIMPKFTASTELSIPDQTGESYTSSIIETDDIYMHTFQLSLEEFTGTLTFQGATDTNYWYDIQDQQFIDSSETSGININGYHPYIRIQVTDNTAGTIRTVLFR